MDHTKTHKTAVIHPDAQMGEDVSVGPYAVIGPQVSVGEGSVIESHCILAGRTTIGPRCRIYSGAVVGNPPQDKKFKETDEVYLVLGQGNVIREYVTINPGTIEGGGKTVIGNNNLFMAYSHVAHDCIIGNNCVMANSGTLAGHVTLEDNVMVGGLSAVHQFVRLGRLAIIGGCSKVVQDIPPFSMCDGHPARVFSLNLVGLRRANISPAVVPVLKKAFKYLFHSGLTKTHALEHIEEELPASPELEQLISFVKTTKRGLCS
ncbi:MAG TPA: acyl-ACP--UDP-N-acetylglucosamine O-acyltransferase [Candidatus Omnitrophota bacterium]|nr:acyl-ACP--UDP-N-acetylglucosamine O-acyltransferase [Candidatus Omnitrophota bacterium]HQP12698.1 acyl-ACP--UDP-N-acetylglucosamine O-acyltransferase [Candidatus Omnitrophota bacterium]